MISDERLLELWEATPGLVYEDVLVVFARAVEAEAYEAAAKVCDGMAYRKPWECAAAIRRLRAAYCEELGVAISLAASSASRPRE